MIKREITETVYRVTDKTPVVVITGPRQSGKTTLVKALFNNYKYMNLEHPEERTKAQLDPLMTLQGWEQGIILDEIQRVPVLLSYIQALTDEKGLNGKVILTGSQNLNMIESITQSLAGRAILHFLMPFSIVELDNAGILPDTLNELIYTGFYPRLYDTGIKPADFYPSYIQTYFERDLRQLINIKDLSKFQLLVKLAAGRTGRIINYHSLSNETGADEKTVKSWLRLLETSHIIFFLQPFYVNFGKRLIKSPKLFFNDTGLLCSLLGIRSNEQLSTHYLWGNIFENFIISDIRKNLFNLGIYQNLYFWRDNTGNEIDCIYEDGQVIKAIEIKSSITFNPDFLKNLGLIKKLAGNYSVNTFLVTAGQDHYEINKTTVLPWNRTHKLL